jgi:pyrimidine-nucleoside phosphorylase
MYDIIIKKRNGGELSGAEINFFVDGVTNGTVPDYQISALLMAIYFTDMTESETSALTLAMADSGESVDLSPINGVKVDKHSTGGVGDKTTLIIAPIAASCGLKVAKMSGRGLGHTGGTVDKLEAFDGLKTDIDRQEFFDIVNRTGIAVIGQSGNLAPADKKLYALRDVTGTVESIPLIAASIMSKKLAAGCDCIVLDVKVGSGAFMKTKQSAEKLAETMIRIGESAGKKCDAVISNMDIPLGSAIGNSLEVIEAIETLSGVGPDDLRDECILLAGKMLSLAGLGDFEYCKKLVLEKIQNGEAKAKFAEMVKAQGGNEKWVYNTDLFPKAKFIKAIKASESGKIIGMNTEKIGISSVMLGAGRATKEDDIDFSAGIKVLAKTGDFINKNDDIAIMYANDESLFIDAEAEYLSALNITTI